MQRNIPTTIVAELTDRIGAVFRHLVPGVLVALGAATAHPSAFGVSINRLGLCSLSPAS